MKHETWESWRKASYPTVTWIDRVGVTLQFVIFVVLVIAPPIVMTSYFVVHLFEWLLRL